MAQRILGLDIGATAVKAVLLEGSYRGFAVADFGEAPLPPASEGGPSLRERQAAALASLLAEKAWTVDACVAVTPGASVAAHLVSLPFTDPRRIEQTVPFEVEAQIPYELQEAAWDWQSLGERNGGTDLWVGVTPRDEVAGLLELLAGAGLDPRSVVPAAPALAALFGGGAAGGPAPAPGEEAPVEALLDLGASRTLLCLAAGGRLEAARTLALGADALAATLAAELGIPAADAASLLAAAAGQAPFPPALAALAGDPRTGRALGVALAPLVRELRATLRGWRTRAGQRPVARLELCGGLARLPGLPELLAPEIEGPVAPLQLTGTAAERIPAEQAPGLALALAAALRGHLAGRAGRLNLRRGALSFTRDFEHLRGKVYGLAAGVALVLLLAAASTGVKVFALSRREAAIDKVLCDAQTRILGKCFANTEEAISVLRGRGVPGASIPKGSAAEVLAELAARAPDGVPLRLDRIDITDKKLHLQGTTDSAENVDKIVAGLHASRCFADARSQSVRKRSADGKFEFGVDATLACGGPVAGGE